MRWKEKNRRHLALFWFTVMHQCMRRLSGRLLKCECTPVCATDVAVMLVTPRNTYNWLMTSTSRESKSWSQTRVRLTQKMKSTCSYLQLLVLFRGVFCLLLYRVLHKHWTEKEKDEEEGTCSSAREFQAFFVQFNEKNLWTHFLSITPPLQRS